MRRKMPRRYAPGETGQVVQNGLGLGHSKHVFRQKGIVGEPDETAAGPLEPLEPLVPLRPGPENS